MTMNQWVIWKPADEVAKKYRLESLTTEMELPDVLLTEVGNNKKKLLLNFEYRVFSYRKTKLCANSHIVQKLNEQHGLAFAAEWSFFKVGNSSYAQWVSDQSYNFIPFDHLIHFAIITEDALLEFVSGGEPEISHVDELIAE